MNTLWRLRNLVCAWYAWSASLFFGAVLIDVVYSSLLRASGASVFGEVSDFLLLLGVPMLLAAVAALALSWNTPSSRNLIALSLLCLSLEFFGPIVLFPVLRTSADPLSRSIGPTVRLASLALASLLAMGAFRALFLESRAPASNLAKSRRF